MAFMSMLKYKVFALLSAGGATAVSVDDFRSVLDNLTSQISVSTIIAVIGAAIGAGIGLVFMWWGVRKLVRAVMNAFKKGKLTF